MNMKSVEKPSQVIADTLSAWAKDNWCIAKFQAPIYKTRCGGMSFSRIDFDGDERPLEFDWDGVDIVNRAALNLRDDILITTGHRIWGVVFTLYSDGKFNIEYDYNEPEGYEEIDETMDLSQALQELQKHGVEISLK